MEKESNLVIHAKREMELVGLNAPDSDYDGEIYKAVLELVKTFSSQDHSGGSAQMALSIFNQVAHYKTLSPITSNPDDWFKYTEEMAGTDDCWQSKRCPSVFSKDGGKTWYDLDGVHNNPEKENEVVKEQNADRAG